MFWKRIHLHWCPSCYHGNIYQVSFMIKVHNTYHVCIVYVEQVLTFPLYILFHFMQAASTNIFRLACFLLLRGV